MAHIYRLIIALGLMCCSFAFAGTPKVDAWRYEGVNYPTIAAACGAYISRRNSHPTRTYDASMISTEPPNWCKLHLVQRKPPGYEGSWDNPGTQDVWESFTLVKVCPAGTTEKADGTCESSGQCPIGMEQNSSGACVCKPGLEKGPDGICQPNEDTQCKTFYALGNTIGGRFTQEYRLTGKIPDGSKFCMPGQFENENRGCIVLFEQWAAFASGQDWVTEGKFDGKPGDNGLACTVGTGDTPAIPKPEKCPKGYTGTVNGVEVCVDKVPDSGFEPGSDETTVDDGTNTTTTRTNSNTTCENGRCTTTTAVTTTVTNNASGSTTTNSSSTTTTQSQSDYCKANPKAKLCGGSGLPNIEGGGSGGGGNGEEDPSSFTGACAGGFQCKGDAIQCAIAREQHIRACRLFDKESPESKLYEEFKGKEGDQTKELPGNETVSIGDKINTTDALGAGGAGLSDLSLTVLNQQVTLPLSMLNQYLAAMGNVLVAVSFLLAFRIVARG